MPTKQWTKRPPGGRRTAVAALAVLTATATAWAGALPVLAGPTQEAKAAEAGDGKVTVNVIHEVNADGARDSALEPGWEGVKVTLTDDDNNQVTGTTDASGKAVIDPGTELTGGKYRVQVHNPDPDIYSSAFASKEGSVSGGPDKLSSTEEFVNLSGGKNQEITTGFWNPADYCQKNADLAACLLAGEDGETSTEYSPNDRTIVTHPHETTGKDASTDWKAKSGDTGTVNGLGYDRERKKLYSAAYAKRGTEYGPGGPNAIYVTDPATKETKQFTTVPGDSPDHDYATDEDQGFMPAVGKSSLGDVDVSEDNSELYVVGLSTKTLYTYDITQDTAAGPKKSVPIPDPGCAGGEDNWRPAGLGVHDGKVFVGGVCTGEGSDDASQMKAVVSTYDPDSGTVGSPIMNQPLDFPRGDGYSKYTVCHGPRWYTWSDEFRAKQEQRDGSTADCTSDADKEHSYPQPMLFDIEQDTDGQLIVDFRDRYADQGGLQMPMLPGNPDDSRYHTILGGDINRACLKDGKYVMDGNGGCKNNGTYENNGGEANDVKEFYPGENRFGTHQEVSTGSLALNRASDKLAYGAMDPNNEIKTSGTGYLNRSDGTSTNSDGNELATAFGKAGAMGDLETMCDLAPLQVGNRVWYDVDKDGIQDPGEDPVKGATVNLYDADGKKIASDKTTDRGEYYFDSTLVGNVPADKWKTNTDYKVAVDNPKDYESGGPLYHWNVTQHDAGDNNFIDSDGVVPAGGKYPEYKFKTGDAGENNHTYDFGYNADFKARVEKKDTDTGDPLAGATFQLWKESNGRDGLQMRGDDPDTMVQQDCTTGADGVCEWDELPPGEYYFYELNSPAGYLMPKQRVTGPFTLSTDTPTKTVERENTPRHRIAVRKVDSETDEPLKGAKFQLWSESNGQEGLQTDGDNPDTKVRPECTTGAGGLCLWLNLEAGTPYYIEETAAPDGYLLPKDPVVGPVTLAKGGDNDSDPSQSYAVKQKNEPQTPDIDIEKQDRKTESDADSKDEAVIGDKVEDQLVDMTIKNTGTEDLTNVEVTDSVTAGEGDVKDLTCTFPDGSTATDPEGKSVRWDASWAETDPAHFKVGDSFKCTTVVTGVPAGVLHTDDATVSGDGAYSGKHVGDRDPWNYKVPTGAIKVLKKDAKSGKALRGAVFQLWQESGAEPGLQKSGKSADKRIDSGCATGASGVCSWKDLDKGSYYIVETDVPEGYVLPSDPVTGPVKLDNDHLTRTYTLKNNPETPGKK